MNIHNITTIDMNNGEGLRTVLWVSGCIHHCEGCQNPCTWDVNDGVLFTKEVKEELMEKVKMPYISGITFSGGDPLHPQNRLEVGDLIEEISALKDKDIWLYTGYTWEEVLSMNLSFLEKIDVLIDGKYEKDQKDLSLHWRGSKNQRVIDVKKSLETNIVCTKEEERKE